MFEDNPCRWNVFEVFRIDRSTTELRDIREREKLARDELVQNLGQVRLRNSELRASNEAQFNGLAKLLYDPVLRLQEEQFVHQAHSFASDEELVNALRGLSEQEEPPEVPAVAGAALVGALGPLLPNLSRPHMEDNLPWPEAPTPFEIEREPLEDAILREN